MRTFTKEQLAEILQKHKKWVNGEEGGEKANLRDADLSFANLRAADLRDADLSSANLCAADLSSANLRDADLCDADLSSAKNLVSSINYMEAHFERTEEGYIAYKTFNSFYEAPERWTIAPGSVIDEVVNECRTTMCGSGINVAPLEWVGRGYPGKTIWKVLIRWEWLPGVCVPYNTDGKIRCERVELVEAVK
jgi:hypothetical protein